MTDQPSGLRRHNRPQAIGARFNELVEWHGALRTGIPRDDIGDNGLRLLPRNSSKMPAMRLITNSNLNSINGRDSQNIFVTPPDRFTTICCSGVISAANFSA